jgi:hypothetical protein
MVFRIRHELGEDDAEHEGRLVDVTAVFLGFGIVATNAAYRYRASGEFDGYVATTRWSHSEIGALSPQAMAYLLALQLVARDARASERRAVSRQLETNQASYFDAACREHDHEALRDALALPDPGAWPARRAAPPEPEGMLSRLKRAAASPRAAVPRAIVTTSTATGGPNTGRAVFRVPHTRAGVGIGVGMMTSFVPVIGLAVTGHAGLAIGSIAALSLAGAVIGSRMRRHECSDADCGMILPVPAGGRQRCPRCGGTIAGTLQRGENRLEAEERLGLNAGDYDLDVGGSGPGSAREVAER